ncbi:MAG: hypothetical protein KC468_27145 [Myxococcales bacterium]|nr:hypothetical protein [Myxococcales bacterium]
MSSRARAALATALLAAVAGLTLPSCRDDTRALAEDYVAAVNTRAASFCRCFAPLVGYRSTDILGCVESERFEDEQRACVIDLLMSAEGPSPDEAIACLMSVELDYAYCLDALSCDDLDGLARCMTTYNDDARACPSLSERDRQQFVNCHFVE